MKPTSVSITEGLDLRGKTAVVTGASSGLGREVARVLALRGARVVLACRNAAKAEQVVRDFEALDRPRGDAARCEIVACDTSSMASIRGLAGALAQRQAPVDLLFLNAGVFGVPYRLTEEGLEYTHAANYIGHFLLVHLLASSGTFARQARILGTLSEGARLPWSRFDLDLVTRAGDSEPRFSKMRASPNSKLLLALMMVELTRRIAGTPLASADLQRRRAAGDPHRQHQPGERLRELPRAHLRRPGDAAARAGHGAAAVGRDQPGVRPGKCGS